MKTDDPKIASVLWAAFADELEKIAEASSSTSKKNKTVETLMAFGIPLAGFTAGTALGFGAGQLADKIHQKVRGTPIPSSFARHVVPPLAAGLGATYALYKAQHRKDIRRALEDEPNRRAGSP
jgi:hypothetical protein